MFRRQWDQSTLLNIMSPFPTEQIVVTAGQVAIFILTRRVLALIKKKGYLDCWTTHVLCHINTPWNSPPPHSYTMHLDNIKFFIFSN